MVILLCFVWVFFTLALGVLRCLFITLWLLCFVFLFILWWFCVCVSLFMALFFYGFMVFFSKIVNILDLFLCLFKKINLFMSQRGHIKSIYSFLWTFYIYFMSLCGHFISIYDFLWTFCILMIFMPLSLLVPFASTYVVVQNLVKWSQTLLALCRNPCMSLLCFHVKNVRESVWATCELIKQLSKDWHIAENIKNLENVHSVFRRDNNKLCLW